MMTRLCALLMTVIFSGCAVGYTFVNSEGKLDRLSPTMLECQKDIGIAVGCELVRKPALQLFIGPCVERLSRAISKVEGEHRRGHQRPETQHLHAPP